MAKQSTGFAFRQSLPGRFAGQILPRPGLRVRFKISFLPNFKPDARGRPGGICAIAAGYTVAQQRSGPATLVADVRKANELASGMFTKALNVPPEALKQHPRQIPHSRVMYVYCAGGNRSMMAVSILPTDTRQAQPGQRHRRFDTLFAQ